MIASLPPGMILLIGSLLLPLLKGRIQAAWLLLLPALSLLHLVSLPQGNTGEWSLFSCQLTLVRIDSLSQIFGFVFHLAAFLSALYALHVRDTTQHVAAMVYAGSAMGAVFAGDLLTLFVYWEITAVSSVFLIWSSRTESAYHAGMRYLVIQVGSGVLLLSGILLHFHETGSLAFNRLIGSDGQLLSASPAVFLIFLAFGIKCAFPLLHNWLQDGYPQATVTGTVFLSAFTTKLAVYALARGFAGTHLLIWIGLLMTLFPIFFAVIENDLRRVLAYSLNNQLGFMVVGIGVGTAMSLNGTAAHAFAHILYKGLLFMSMGAVLYRAGTIKASELGGLYKSMPFTTVFCMIGAASISAFPLFSGFVSKSLILSAVADKHQLVIWLGLLVASAGVMEHSGIKIPYFAFFAHDAGIRCKEAPWNMLLAMGITAALCVLIGCLPQALLYDWLPFIDTGTGVQVRAASVTPELDFQPYTSHHVVTQLQLLLFATMAFAILVRSGIYPPEIRSVNLDSDWFYRRPFLGTPNGGPSPVERLSTWAQTLRQKTDTHVLTRLRQTEHLVRGFCSVYGRQTNSIRAMVVWVSVLLTAYLLLYYFYV